MLGYTKVFGHDISGGLFSLGDVGNKNPDNPDAELFSILDQLETYRGNDGNFLFKICYPELTMGGRQSHCNVWLQSSNPYTESIITGFKPVSLSFPFNGDGEDWQGLGLNEDTSKAWIDDAPSSSQWWMAIGAISDENGKLPGPSNQDDLMVTQVELFVSTSRQDTNIPVGLDGSLVVSCKNIGEDFDFGYNINQLSLECGYR